MRPGRKQSSERWKPHSQGARRLALQFTVSALAAALVTLTAVAAEATATLEALVEQVITKQAAGKPAPAEKAKPDDKAAAKAKTTKKTIVARKAVAAKKVIVNANPNVNPMIQQLVQQGKPMMHAELLFARGLCKLDKPTLVKIYPEMTQVLEDVAKQLTNGQMRVIRPGAKNPDATTLLQTGIAAVLKKHLSADQYTRYQAESAKRLETRKQAAVRFMVDAIDREVLLSPDQRSKITESLSKNWDDGWIMYVEYLLYGNQFFPNDIDKYVNAALNETQKKVWQTTQKVNVGWGFGGIWMFNGQADPVGDLLGIEPKKAEPQAAVMVRVAPAAKKAAPAKPAPKAETKTEKKADAKSEKNAEVKPAAKK